MTARQHECVVAWEELMSKPHRSRREQARLEALTEELAPLIMRFATGYGDALRRANAGDLHLAIREGIVTFDLLGIWDARGQPRSLDDLVMEEYARAVHASLTPNSPVLPVFDALEEDIRGAVSTASAVSVTGMHEAGLARELIARLPSFAGTPMEAVLEARSLVADSLVAFRSAVIEAACTLEACPLDPRWQLEVDRVCRRVVAPALREIREALDQRKVAKVLRRAATSGGVPGAAIGLAAYAAVGSVEMATAIGFASKMADSLVSELKIRSELDRATRRNGFFFLHQVSSALSLVAD